MKSINRKEAFMAAMAGEGEAPKPLTREEEFASKIADRIGQGGGSVVVTLGEESLVAVATAMEAFYTAALATAGAFVSVTSVGGLSEVTEIITYLQQGKTVFIDTGEPTSHAKIEIIAYQDVNPIGIQAHIAGFGFHVTESVSADSIAAMFADEGVIKINGFAIITT